MTYTTEEFVRHSLHRILRSVKYRNSFLCLPCLVTMTRESLHPGWRVRDAWALTGLRGPNVPAESGRVPVCSLPERQALPRVPVPLTP
jgi:hypothetical protein